jgi:hypothetical protein
LSAAKKRDSNLLFASSSSIFENFFSQYLADLAFLTTFNLFAFAIQSSAAKRRDFDLLSQRRQVLLKNSFELLIALAGPLKPARETFQLRAPPLSTPRHLPATQRCGQRSPRL